MHFLSCHFSSPSQHLPSRLVFRETPRARKPKHQDQPQAAKPEDQAQTEARQQQKAKPKAASNKTGSFVKAERVRQLREAIKTAKAEMPVDVLASRLEEGHDEKTAFEQYPEGEKLKTDVVRAETRKRVSKILYSEDRKAESKDREEVIERQINRYYEYDIGDKKLRGHVEAPHGIEPSEKAKAWCKERKIASHETHTAEITKETANWMVFKHPRLLADVNSLPIDVESSLRAENSAYTKEDNLNALKAERDLSKEMLRQQDCLDENELAKNPYLAIYLHGKVDTRGNDFEIAAKEEKGKSLINPLLAFWIAERLKEKIEKKGMKNSKGETPSVNVVTYAGSYSGSKALRALRNGDGTFDFKGLGENFQALQLECGAHIRKEYQTELSETLQELLQDFSTEFKSAEDMKKLEKYRDEYKTKLEQEKDDFFKKENVIFDEAMPKDEIALTNAVRDVLEIRIGDKVKVAGKEFKVTDLSPAERKETGKRMKLNKEYEAGVGEKVEIEVVGKTSGGQDAHDAGEKKADDAKHAEHATADEEAKKESDALWNKIKRGVKNLGKNAWSGIKSFFPWAKH